MARFALLLALTSLTSLTACPQRPPPRPPVPGSLQLATRQSCGVLSGLDYDTSCLAAVFVLVLDETKRPVFQTCHVLPARSPDLRTLLEEPIIDITGLSAQGVVTFEVRGFHDVGALGTDPCASPATTDNWLFWGESEPVDLAQYDDGDGPPLIRIVLDCRDCTDANEVFGCGGIILQDAGVSPGTCGPELPDSFCVPTVACDKGCADDSDCFEGARSCIEDTCDLEVLTGGLCSPCGGAIACSDETVCVKKPGQAAFCAPPCPDALCPTGTKCNRRGNGLELAN